MLNHRNRFNGFGACEFEKKCKHSKPLFSESKILHFVRVTLSIADRNVPVHSNKYSNRTGAAFPWDPIIHNKNRY